MNCENIQEIILTDYVDGQMSPEQKSGIDWHLSSCTACREFAGLAQKMTVEPFRNSQKADLPQEVIWQSIKEKIESEAAPAPQGITIPDFWARLKDMFRLPQPVLALASVAVMIFTVTVFMVSGQSNQYVKGDQLQDEIKSIAYVVNEIITDTDDTGSGYDTVIEEYFL